MQVALAHICKEQHREISSISTDLRLTGYTKSDLDPELGFLLAKLTRGTKLKSPVEWFNFRKTR